MKTTLQMSDLQADFFKEILELHKQGAGLKTVFKPNPVGFWVFLHKQKIGRIIQKLSNLKP